MAKRKKGLDIHGILLLDKRLGVSSNKALQEVKRLFNANKAGHTGSLDPLATGLLPICFGEATKVSAYMLEDDKRYRVMVQLGVITDSGDAEGQVIEQNSVPEFSEEQIQQCLNSFIGEIEQVPPMYSALKVQGKKLYELAREGKTVERKARKITIFAIELLAQHSDRLELEVSCSKGTYIRTLAEDIGYKLGCGATVSALRRLSAGPFSIDQALTIEQLQSMQQSALMQLLIDVDKPLEKMPIVTLSTQQTASAKQGRQLILEASMQGMVRMYSEHGFFGLGELLMDGKLAPKKLFNI